MNVSEVTVRPTIITDDDQRRWADVPVEDAPRTVTEGASDEAPADENAVVVRRAATWEITGEVDNRLRLCADTSACPNVSGGKCAGCKDGHFSYNDSGAAGTGIRCLNHRAQNVTNDVAQGETTDDVAQGETTKEVQPPIANWTEHL